MAARGISVELPLEALVLIMQHLTRQDQLSCLTVSKLWSEAALLVACSRGLRVIFPWDRPEPTQSLLRRVVAFLRARGAAATSLSVFHPSPSQLSRLLYAAPPRLEDLFLVSNDAAALRLVPPRAPAMLHLRDLLLVCPLRSLPSLQPLAAATSLRLLGVRGWEVSSAGRVAGMQQLAATLPAASSVTHLRLYLDGFDLKVMEAVGTLTQLERLEIGSRDAIDFSHIEEEERGPPGRVKLQAVTRADYGRLLQLRAALPNQHHWQLIRTVLDAAGAELYYPEALAPSRWRDLRQLRRLVVGSAAGEAPAEGGGTMLERGLAALPALEDLTLYCLYAIGGLYERSWAVPPRDIWQCTGLTRLALHHARMDLGTVEVDLPRLQHLRLEMPSLPGPFPHALFLPQLRQLDIKGLGAEPGLLDALPLALAQCTQLEYLELSSVPGLAAPPAPVLALTTLTTLLLPFNPLEELPPGPYLSRLRQLNISGQLLLERPARASFARGAFPPALAAGAPALTWLGIAPPLGTFKERHGLRELEQFPMRYRRLARADADLLCGGALPRLRELYLGEVERDRAGRPRPLDRATRAAVARLAEGRPGLQVIVTNTAGEGDPDAYVL